MDEFLQFWQNNYHCGFNLIIAPKARLVVVTGFSNGLCLSSVYHRFRRFLGGSPTPDSEPSVLWVVHYFQLGFLGIPENCGFFRGITGNYSDIFEEFRGFSGISGKIQRIPGICRRSQFEARKFSTPQNAVPTGNYGKPLISLVF